MYYIDNITTGSITTNIISIAIVTIIIIGIAMRVSCEKYKDIAAETIETDELKSLGQFAQNDLKRCDPSFRLQCLLVALLRTNSVFVRVLPDVVFVMHLVSVALLSTYHVLLLTPDLVHL